MALSSILQQLAKQGGGNQVFQPPAAAPKAELMPGSATTNNLFDPNKGYGKWFTGLPNLQRITNPKDGGPIPGVHGIEAYTDGTHLYSVNRQQFGGSGMTNDYGPTENTAFPVSIDRAKLSDFYRHEETGELRPRIGSVSELIHPDTGEVYETNNYAGRSSNKTFKNFLMAAAIAMSMGSAASVMAGQGALGSVAGGAGNAAGAAGAGGTAGASSAGGSSLFGGFGTPSAGYAGAGQGFSSGMSMGSGLGSTMGAGAGGFGATLGSAMTSMGSGAGGALGGGMAGGTPPPSNPYSLGSYFNPQNLGNLAESGIRGYISDPKNWITNGLRLLNSGGGSSSGGGGMGNGGGFNLGDLFNLGAGALDAKRQGDASDKMINWLNGQQDYVRNYGKEGSPEFEYLKRTLEAKDAASGRNSQYGHRATDLLGQLGQAKLDASTRMALGFASPYQKALSQDAAKYAGLSAAGQRMFGNGPQNLSSILNGLGSNGLDFGGTDGLGGYGTDGTPVNGDFFDQDFFGDSNGFGEYSTDGTPLDGDFFNSDYFSGADDNDIMSFLEGW